MGLHLLDPETMTEILNLVLVIFPSFWMNELFLHLQWHPAITKCYGTGKKMFVIAGSSL